MKKMLMVLIFALCGGAVWAQEPVQVSASVDRSTLAVNDQLVLTVTLSGPDAQKAERPTPDLGQFLKYLGSGGTSQNFQFVNGKTSITISTSYRYLATKEGKFTIPAISLEYKGKTYQSQPIDITVLKATAQQQQRQPSSSSQTSEPADIDLGDNLFLRAIVNKTKVYQNEPVYVTFRIYTKVNVAQYGLNKMPKVSGFWSEEFDMKSRPQTSEQVYKGERYITADLKKMALFPTSPGEKTIGSMVIDCDVRVQNRRRTRDIFDSFFDDPFFNRTVRKTISSYPVEIKVLPFPRAGQPANFSGLSGKFDLNATVDKTDVSTDEAVTLKVTISGQGNIKIISEPEIAIPNDFERYDPTISESINRSGDIISGQKTFEYVLIPRYAGKQRIQPISFSYFDPTLEKYVTRTSPEFVINVSQGEKQLVSLGPGLSKKEVQLVGQDIRYIKMAMESIHRIGAKPYTSPAFLAALFIPLLGLIGSAVYQSHAEKLAQNEAYARRRRANRMAMKKLSAAKSLLAEKTRKEFNAEIHKAVTGFAADKMDMAAAGLISAELQKQLTKHNVDQELIDETKEILQTADFYRFGMGEQDKEEMKAFYNRAKNVIIKMDKAL
ncbi:hypothetical protein GF406_02755 [candidate division KSB1 bacterium]|nr:hypothetical protein [candidate division KSB1 bacterium]